MLSRTFSADADFFYKSDSKSILIYISCNFRIIFFRFDYHFVNFLMDVTDDIRILMLREC